MKKKWIAWYLIFNSLAVIQSCVKTVEIDMPPVKSQIVVDGWIESGANARVVLLLTSPYFSDVDSASIQKFVITQAKVTVSNAEQSEILTLEKNTAYFPPYVYKSNKIKGVPGVEYSLKVEYSGHVLTAKTTIPPIALLDTVWYKNNSSTDTLGTLEAQFTDDPSAINYYRILTKVKGKDKRFVNNRLAIYSDAFSNGKPFIAQLLKGNNSFNNYGDYFFQQHDTVTVKLCSIDKEQYDFWTSFNREIMNTGNPFASQNNRIKSNIEGGLGIWGGSGVSFYEVIAVE